ncbi:MAG: sulfate transporter CysZ [Candidatus Polarisedimenticolaceae bacterium]|nr:sulfate transporter CysZ [Candidatus Polarisedimenticolaceae bacterium]
MKSNPFAGVGCLIRGLRLITEPSLRPFVVIPLLVNMLIFSLLVWLGMSQFDGLLNQMLPENHWLDFLRWLLWPLFALTFVLIVFYTFTVVANLIASPFNSLLAQKVELLLSGELPEESSSDWREIVVGVGSAVMGEGRKIGYFLVRALPLLVLFLIPGLNLLAPFLWLLFSAWFLALEYADYPMGNHGISFTEQHDRLKQQRMPALGFGGAVTLMMMVPLLNFVAMPAAVAGATILWHERLRES